MGKPCKAQQDKRKGYRLTEEGYKLVSWTEDNPCYCSACSMPPCSSCENGLSEDAAYDIDEYWEVDPDYEEEDMAEKYLFKKDDIVERIGNSVPYCEKRGHYKVGKDQDPSSNCLWIINDKGDLDDWEDANFKLISKADKGNVPTPKSEWFGHKYKVNSETSKLLQEAVFKDGGKWPVSGKEVMYTDSHKILYVYEDGRITTGVGDNEFRNHRLPEKEPPQPTPYEYKVGDKVRVIGNRNSHRRKIGDICYLVAQNSVGGTWKSSTIKDGSWEECCHMHEKDIELVQPELDKEDKKEDNGCTVGISAHIHDYTVEKVITGKPEHTLTIDLTKQEDTTMQTTRKVLNFKLIDSDPALPVDQALVHDFGDVVVEDDIETVKQQLLGDNDLKAILAKHNKKRIENVNLTIQQNTGNTVKLLPLTRIKELTWSVK